MESVRVSVALALIEQDGRWLVGLRSAGRVFAGAWEFPGGRIQPGEHPWRAAERETLEETGLEVQACGGLGELDAETPAGKVTLHLVLCRPAAGRAEPRAEAVQAVRWVPLDELDRLTMPPANAEVVRRLRSHVARRGSEGGPRGQE